jgi:hypothetical protein
MNLSFQELGIFIHAFATVMQLVTIIILSVRAWADLDCH